MKITLISDWQNLNLHCFNCGSDKSVKYLADLNVNGRKGTACVCNMCVLRSNAESVKEGDVL